MQQIGTNATSGVFATSRVPTKKAVSNVPVPAVTTWWIRRNAGPKMPATTVSTSPITSRSSRSTLPAPLYRLAYTHHIFSPLFSCLNRILLLTNLYQLLNPWPIEMNETKVGLLDLIVFVCVGYELLRSMNVSS